MTKFAMAAIVVLSIAPTKLAVAGEYSVSDAGARYGQAVSATKFCPAGVLTDKAKTLKASFIDENAKIFETEAAKVIEGWDKAHNCKDRDPNTHRMTSCGKMKLTNCRQAWLEIGPEGRAIPGLIELNLDNWNPEQ